MVRSKAGRREGRQDVAAFHYCCIIALLEGSEFYQLPHRAITPHLSPLKAVRPKQPNGVSRVPSSGGRACNITFLWLGSFHSNHSPSATSAPSLRPARSEQFPDKFRSVRFVKIIQMVFSPFRFLPTQSSNNSSLSLYHTHNWGGQ
jgi:hypothetical protein